MIGAESISDYSVFGKTRAVGGTDNPIIQCDGTHLNGFEKKTKLIVHRAVSI